MEEYRDQIIKTIIILIGYILTKVITNRLIQRVGKKFKYQSGRIKITNKIVSFILLIILTALLLIIWGINKSQFTLFLSATLTILGVAFFAQWSIISNITSTLIIFFNHPIKIGDSLTIMEKDYEIEGRLSDIGVFFITIKTKENTKITLPSNVFMQKMIRNNEVINDKLNKKNT